MRWIGSFLSGRAPVLTLALAASVSWCAGSPDSAACKTTLFVNSYVNSNEIQSITAWRGLLAMGTLGGIVTVDPKTGAATKILRSPGGLPSNRILSIEVSPSGALWAGTAESGIARLRPDGTFRRTLSSFDGLPGDRVQTIYVRADTIWVGTSAGVALFTENPATGQIGLTRAYTSAGTSGALVGDDVRAFIQVGDTLWCATTSGFSTFAAGGWAARTAALSVPATSLAFYADTLWAATSLGPYQYAGGVFRAANAGHAFASQALHAGPQGLYSGSAALGAYRYGAGAWTAVNAGLPSLRVTAFRDGPDGALWAGTLGGAARLAQGSGSWEPHLSDGPLVNGTVRAVVDQRGAWFSTGNDFPPGLGRGGVLHFDGASWRALTNASTGGGFQEADAFALFSDTSSKLWIGHCCLDGDPRPRVDRYDPGTGVWDAPVAYNIWAINQSPSGRIYAVSVEHENGIYEFAATGALLDSLTPTNSGLTSNNLRAVRFDSAGKGWFGTAFNGVDIWDGRGTPGHADDVWTHVSVPPSDQVTSLAVLGPQTAWIGTSGGASRVENGVLTRVLTSVGNPGLPSAQVNDLALDSQGNVWIATSGGLARADASGTGAIEVFTTQEGLVDNEIRALAWDDARGALWVGTGHGISRVVPTTGGEPGLTDQSYVYPNPSRAIGSLRLGGIRNALDGEIRDLAGNVIHRFRCDPAANEIWDLRNQGGDPAPPGVYLVVLRDKSQSRILRVAVVR